MAERAKKIVIIGGVAGGMSAAARARRLSEEARIIVFEKDRYVSFANCGLPYHISGAIPDREKLFVVTPADLARSLNIEVHTGHEVTSIDRANRRIRVVDHAANRDFDEQYDKLVIATGAGPLIPPIPGVDHPRIFTLRNIDDMDHLKAEVDRGSFSALIVGGGYIGVEMAEALRHRGLRVDVVEKGDQIMQGLDAEMSRDIAYHMESFGVNVHLGVGVREFRDAGGRVEAALTGGGALIVDMVVLAVGVQPAAALARDAELTIGKRGGIVVDEHMLTNDPDIYAVGDVVEVRDAVTGEITLYALAGPANRQGRVAADHVFGRDSQFQGVYGTTVVKVFDMTAGSTGASEKSLRRANIPYAKVYVHPNGHAGYYPGTHPMHLKVLFTPAEGRLLGAQAVGFDGVDKRIDVLATALRAGMTIHDLEDLELGYAPPYGSAKDPVNVAGFVAGNLLRGDVHPWYAEDYSDLPPDALLLDVRSPREYTGWHLPGAANIPIGELRSRLDELESQRNGPIYLYCLSGFRSYLGARILRQNGYERVYNLSGGLKTFVSYHHTPMDKGKPTAPFVSHAEQKADEGSGMPLT